MASTASFGSTGYGATPYGSTPYGVTPYGDPSNGAAQLTGGSPPTPRNPGGTVDVKQYDTGPPLIITLTNGTTPLDLTTASVKVVGNMFGAVVFARTAPGSSAGVVTMPWQRTDTAVPGKMNVEVHVTWPDGTVQTFPPRGYLTVNIAADLG